MLVRHKRKMSGEKTNPKKTNSRETSTDTQTMIREIDESLYSRQLYVMGSDAMKKMSTTNVLITGMCGLGVEIAKNIILGGLSSVILHDTRACTYSDLSTNYYAAKDDIGRNIAEISFKQLSQLNEYVVVRSATNEIEKVDFSNIDVIVIVNQPLSQISKITEFAVEKGIKIVVANTFGLVGSVFCDFGKQFTVFDTTGEEAAVARIERISNDQHGLVTCLEDHRHGFEDGQHVVFQEVKGMCALNQSKKVKIKVLSPNTFSIGDMSMYTCVGEGGTAVEVKTPISIDFSSFSQCLYNPPIFMADFAKMDRMPLLHLCFLTINKFFEMKKRHPTPHDETDAVCFIETAREVNKKLVNPIEKIDECLLKIFSFQCGGHLVALASFIGGIAAQEVLKAATGKFMPIHQFMYFDAFECLPANFVDMNSSLFSPTQSRYDGVRAIFGQDFLSKLQDLHVFLVGAGAIGCEHLKNLAMMGVGVKGHGSVFVTDMDSIQRSNLNRQFLFRSKDLGAFKSEIACESIRKMNDDIDLVPFLLRVGAENEHIFDDAFFHKIHVIMNALDNIDARLYMDSKSTYYTLPLLESGTLGTKGNVQSVIPHLTEAYGSSMDPPEKSIPMCTLKNFPYQTEHAIQWARDLFEGLFTQWPSLIKNYLCNHKLIYNDLGLVDSAKLNIISSSVDISQPISVQSCVEWALKLFHQYFINDIVQLTYMFPEDRLTTHGTPFWAGTKRFPNPIKLQSGESDQYFRSFILSAFKLRVGNLGIKFGLTDDEILACANSIVTPKFVPRQDVKIAVTDSEMQAQTERETNVVDFDNNVFHSKVVAYLNENHISLEDAVFEKDDDTNNHIEFIFAAANLRSLNYRLPLADRLKIKLIAGNIVPAIATTTSVVSGLVALELCKIAQGFKEITSYRNSFVNLALPYFGFSDPIDGKKYKCMDKTFSIWDFINFDSRSRITPDSECTLQEFIDRLKEEYKLNLDMISYGTCLLYGSHLDPRKRRDRLIMPISKIIQLVQRSPIPTNKRTIALEAICVNPDDYDDDILMPTIRYTVFSP